MNFSPKKKLIRRLVRSWVLGALIFAGIFICTSASATTVIRMTVDDLVAHSGLIVSGTVSKKTFDYGDENTMSTTNYTICDLNIIVGTHKDGCLDIVVPGGPQVDGSTLRYVGAPELAVGWTYLLFLDGTANYHFPFVGIWQGVYRVKEDSVKRRVLLSSSGYPVTGVDAGGHIVTHRERVVVSVDDSSLEVLVDEHDEATDVTLGLAMTEEDFVSTIHAAATERLYQGNSIPEGLPIDWRCVVFRKRTPVPPTDEMRRPAEAESEAGQQNEDRGE